MRILLLLATVVAAAAAMPWASAWDQNPESRLQTLPRWDYWPPLPSRVQFTGEYLSSRPGRNHLKPQRFDVINLFDLAADAAHQNALLYGSVLLKPTVLEAGAAIADAAVRRAFEFATAQIHSSAGGSLSPRARLQHAVVLPLSLTGDNGESEMVVAQQYTTLKRAARQFQSHVQLGINFYLTIDDAGFQRRHRVVVALDREGVHNVFQHTHARLDGATDDTVSEACAADGCATPSSSPRILSYNVWNTNPPRDVYGSMRRWAQYSKRLDHLVDIVKDARADIIGFQEVRYDGVFGERGGHAQVQHLAARLPGYQYVYQAAMSYVNDRSPFERIEEGPAVFSKFPIVETDYLLLARDPNDPNDAHQRLCLHAVVDHPTWGRIDVYVTHLSLSERSRERSIVQLWEYMRHGRGATQVLLGDLNAEPQSRGIRFLRGAAELNGVRADLKDAWLETHAEAEPRSSDRRDQQTKFTFPSDSPSKRIDFVLFRGKGAVRECEIVGQQPTADTADFPTDVGLLDARSPVYASDHRGVIAEFVAPP